MRKYVIFILIILALAVGVFAYKRPRPITIAYVSGTTGDLSELGVDSRNGFMMHVEEINEDGGIKGRPVEVVIYNDQNNPDMIAGIHGDIEEAGIHIVVGHLISALDQAVLDRAQDDVLIFSPSISSALMDDRDDNFLRLTGSYRGQVERLADHIYDTQGIEAVTLVYDVRNRAYSEGFSDYFKEVYKGQVRVSFPVGASEAPEDMALIEALEDSGTEGVVMITPANVTARLSQSLEKAGLTLERFSVSWSMTNDLFSDGGSSVEGIHFVYVDYEDETSERYKAYERNFFNRYGYEPSFISALSYETAMVLMEAMKESDDLTVTAVKESIVGHSFEGLNEAIEFNEFGDRKQPFIILESKDGQFIPFDR